MVEFSDRLGWLLAGMVVGYIIRLIQEIRKEVHEVDQIVTKRKRDEDGFMRFPLAADIAVVLVFAMCLWATFTTGATNNKLEDAVGDIKASQVEDQRIQDRLASVTVCTQEYLSQTIEALNQRTEFTQAQADANVKLQRAQTEFLRIVLIRPPVGQEEVEAALADYVERLQEFVSVAGQQKDNVSKYDYPTKDQLTQCLDSDKELKDETE